MCGQGPAQHLPFRRYAKSPAPRVTHILEVVSQSSNPEYVTVPAARIHFRQDRGPGIIRRNKLITSFAVLGVRTLFHGHSSNAPNSALRLCTKSLFTSSRLRRQMRHSNAFFRNGECLFVTCRNRLQQRVLKASSFVSTSDEINKKLLLVPLQPAATAWQRVYRCLAAATRNTMETADADRVRSDRTRNHVWKTLLKLTN